MNTLLAVLFFCAAPATAQPYATSATPQTETGPLSQPASGNETGTQQKVTNQTGISNFMPMRAPAAQDPVPAASPAPAAVSQKSRTVECPSGSEKVGGSCKRRCAQGETRNEKGECGKSGSDQQPSMPALGGGSGEEGDGKKDAAPAGTAAAAKEGTAPKKKDAPAGGDCAGSGGLCGDTLRGERTANKLQDPFKSGLQPGSASTPPQARENPSGYSGELGKVGNWDFNGPRQRAQSAAGEASKAAGDYAALQLNVAQERSSFTQAYGGIRVGVSVAAGLQDVLAKMMALESALNALRSSGSRASASVRAAAEKTSAAADAGTRAMNTTQESFRTTGDSIQSANQTYGRFQTLRQQYNACMDPYTQQQCRAQVAAQASSTKAAYLPDPAVRSAQNARDAAKGARSALKAAQTAQAEGERAVSALEGEGRSARAQLDALKKDFLARFKPSADPNNIARTRAFGNIVEKYGAFLTAAEGIRTGTLAPASANVGEAVNGVRTALDPA